MAQYAGRKETRSQFPHGSIGWCAGAITDDAINSLIGCLDCRDVVVVETCPGGLPVRR